MQPDDYALPAAKRLRAHELGEGGEDETWHNNDHHDHQGGDYDESNGGSQRGSSSSSSSGSSSTKNSEPAMSASEAAYLDQQYAKAGVVWYPDTDQQYNADTTSAGGGATQNAPNLVTQDTDTATSAATSGVPAGATGAGASLTGDSSAQSSTHATAAPVNGANSGAAWRPATDPSSGNTYFYNEMV